MASETGIGPAQVRIKAVSKDRETYTLGNNDQEMTKYKLRVSPNPPGLDEKAVWFFSQASHKPEPQPGNIIEVYFFPDSQYGPTVKRASNVNRNQKRANAQREASRKGAQEAASEAFSAALTAVQGAASLHANRSGWTDGEVIETARILHEVIMDLAGYKANGNGNGDDNGNGNGEPMPTEPADDPSDF